MNLSLHLYVIQILRYSQQIGRIGAVPITKE